ncbi:helix-turn-helix domain-containing protein, partial [Pyramidobacter sp.]
MNKHLTLAERKAIESALNRRESLRSIASTVLKSPSTISREIRKHAETVFKGCYGRTANCCLHRYDCSVTS